MRNSKSHALTRMHLDFYDRQSKLQLKTYSDLKKEKKTKATGKDVILKADRRLFGSMVLVATSRNLNMRGVTASVRAIALGIV